MSMRGASGAQWVQLELALEALCCPLPSQRRLARVARASLVDSLPNCMQLALNLFRKPRVPILTMIQTDAPPRPECFADDEAWKSWLTSAHESGERIARRVDIGKSRGERHTFYVLLPTRQIDYCAECPLAKRQEMSRQGRCHPCDAALQPEPEDACV